MNIDARRTDMKQTLLQQAVKLLDEQGAAAVTIRAVARGAGVSHAAPVNHYRDRQTLLTAIARREFAVIASDIQRMLVSATGTKRIQVFGEALHHYAMQHPNRYQLLWRADLVDHSEHELAAIMDGIYDQLCSEIDRAYPGHGFDRDTLAIGVWSLAHGYSDMRAVGMFEERRDSANGLPRFDAMLRAFLGE